MQNVAHNFTPVLAGQVVLYIQHYVSQFGYFGAQVDQFDTQCSPLVARISPDG